VTRERIRQIEAKALRRADLAERLRHCARMAALRDGNGGRARARRGGVMLGENAWFAHNPLRFDHTLEEFGHPFPSPAPARIA
jgi:hypothetical protein